MRASDREAQAASAALAPVNDGSGQNPPWVERGSVWASCLRTEVGGDRGPPQVGQPVAGRLLRWGQPPGLAGRALLALSGFGQQCRPGSGWRLREEAGGCWCCVTFDRRGQEQVAVAGTGFLHCGETAPLRGLCPARGAGCPLAPLPGHPGQQGRTWSRASPGALGQTLRDLGSAWEQL